MTKAYAFRSGMRNTYACACASVFACLVMYRNRRFENEMELSCGSTVMYMCASRHLLMSFLIMLLK